MAISSFGIQKSFSILAKVLQSKRASDIQKCLSLIISRDSDMQDRL